MRTSILCKRAHRTRRSPPVRSRSATTRKAAWWASHGMPTATFGEYLTWRPDARLVRCIGALRLGRTDGTCLSMVQTHDKPHETSTARRSPVFDEARNNRRCAPVSRSYLPYSCGGGLCVHGRRTQVDGTYDCCTRAL